MNIRFRVINLTRDRRTPDLKRRAEWLEQAFQSVHAQRRQDERDAQVEAIFERRVRDNVLGIRRARDDHQPMLLRRQAS